MSEFTFQTLRKNVLNYAQRRKLVKPIEEMGFQAKSQFLLILGIHGLIPKKVPVSLDVVITEFWELFLDWYFFEREEARKRTIVELYVESEDFKKDFPYTNAREADMAARKLREPLWGHFVVCGKDEKDEYEVKLLEGETICRIHDTSTFSDVSKGNVIFAKLYPFGNLHYVSQFIQVYPQELLEEYEKVKTFKGQLEELFGEFMATRKVKMKTVQKYEEMYFLLSEYVIEKGYKSLRQIKKMNVDTWAKWIRRQCQVSRYKEDECRSALKQFLKFLDEKE